MIGSGTRLRLTVKQRHSWLEELSDVYDNQCLLALRGNGLSKRHVTTTTLYNHRLISSSTGLCRVSICLGCNTKGQDSCSPCHSLSSPSSYGYKSPCRTSFSTLTPRISTLPSLCISIPNLQRNKLIPLTMCYHVTVNYMCSVCSNRIDSDRHSLRCQRARRSLTGVLGSCGSTYSEMIWNYQETCRTCANPEEPELPDPEDFVLPRLRPPYGTG